MADGVAITAGSGTTIKTSDQGATGHVQVVQPAWGADGAGSATATLTNFGSGLPCAADTNVLTGTMTATGAWSLGSVSALGYVSGSIELTGTFVGSVNVQVSNDGSNWSSLYVNQANAGNATGYSNTVLSNTYANIQYVFVTAPARYFRVNCNSYTSGTITANVVLSATPLVQMTPPVAVALMPTVYVQGEIGAYMSYTTDLSSSARTASGTGTSHNNTSNGPKGVNLNVIVTAVSGTSPTLTVAIQRSADNTNWFNIPNAVTPTITGTGAWDLTVAPGIQTVANQCVPDVLSAFWRVAYTIGGTTPSFTFATNYCWFA